MRGDAAAADRRHEVRDAARGWQRAGAIDDATRAAIEAAHPDDRARLGPAFRVLVFVFTGIVAGAVFGLIVLTLGRHGAYGLGTLLVPFGLLLAVATEIQKGPLRRAEGGSEAATAFLAVGFLLGGAAWLLDQAGFHGDAWLQASLATTVVLCGAAAWRWGYALLAVAAAVALFVLAARPPGGRLLWVPGALVLALAFARVGDAAALAPAHRRGARGMAAVSLVALYLAVNLRSVDAGWIEMLSGRTGRPAFAAIRAASALATALVPLLTLAWGLRTRRRWLIALGTLGVAASLVTLRYYVHVAPLWVVLIASGTAALAVAAALRRYLEAGPGGERAGLTADPLFTESERPSVLEIVVGAAVTTPEGRPQGSEPDLKPGGGRYGGGGASGNY